MISFKQEDDILKVFQNGRYMGYVDQEQMLYLFDRTQSAVAVQNIESRTQIHMAVNNWKGF